MKILLNSYPLSGHIPLTQSIIRLTGAITKDNPEQMAEGSNWVIWKQEPIIFLGNYNDDILLCSVLRNPLEVISLNVDRWFSGISEKMVYNIPAGDDSNKNQGDTLSNRDIEFINHQVRMYKSYANSLDMSKKDIYITSYDKYISNGSAVIIDILNKAKVDFSLVNTNDIMINHDVDKPETKVYDQIVEIIKNNPDFNYINNWYLNKIN